MQIQEETVLNTHNLLIYNNVSNAIFVHKI